MKLHGLQMKKEDLEKHVILFIKQTKKMCKEEKGESYLYLYGENPQAVGQTHLENKNNKGQIIYTEERSISTLYTSN